MAAPMIKVEVDGKTVEVPNGTMVMEAANRLGIYVPHFCYHKKLSIAANCSSSSVRSSEHSSKYVALKSSRSLMRKLWPPSGGAPSVDDAVDDRDQLLGIEGLSPQELFQKLVEQYCPDDYARAVSHLGEGADDEAETPRKSGKRGSAR